MLDLPNRTTSVDASLCDTTDATSATRDSQFSGLRSSGNKVFQAWAREGLTWLEDFGVGYLPVTGSPYDESYFAKYAGYANTHIGWQLNRVRLDMVARHFSGGLVDVGIGCGTFVQSRPWTSGYDVNPAGVDWLLDRGLFIDPYAQRIEAATFWDSLEHIADPAPLLANVSKWVFVSLPIFRDLAHVLGSRHLRRDEHCWYWTEHGFRMWMVAHGWRCVERNDMETKLGREDIMSFAFTRLT